MKDFDNLTVKENIRNNELVEESQLFLKNILKKLRSNLPAEQSIVNC